MKKGFLIKCEECGNEVTFKSKSDDYMGFNGADIYSSNTALIIFSNNNKKAIINCKCGNIIADY